MTATSDFLKPTGAVMACDRRYTHLVDRRNASAIIQPDDVRSDYRSSDSCSHYHAGTAVIVQAAG